MTYILKNGLKLIYKQKEGDITSFCIGFNAGALEETEFKLGVAHAVEHMLYKGTINRTEFEINKKSDEIFGFTNAMTNYPYAIYYGTTLSSDFESGIDIISDILLNATFPEEGFSEEINIIKEELKEWSDDIYQHCEDELLYNAFKNRRIKDLIIGTEDSINSITLQDLKKFYNTYYTPENCVISVVSSLSFNLVRDIVENYFDKWNNKYSAIIDEYYETNIPGVFTKENNNINGAKIQYIFPISSLSYEELKALSIFNLSFGEGTSSLLYDEIRTKNGLAYEIYSGIKNERGIKLFTIVLGTSTENIEKAIDIINCIIDYVKNSVGYFTNYKINSISKSLKLKRALKLERSIELCKYLTTYELMYGDYKLLEEEISGLDNIDEMAIKQLINKVLVNPTIQVIKP